MNNIDAHIYGSAANAAILRVCLKSGIDIAKAFEYMAFIFASLGITGQNSYEKFLEYLKYEDKTRQLSEAALEYCDFDGLFQFLTAMLDSSDSIADNMAKTQESASEEKLCKNRLRDAELNKFFKEIFGWTDPESVAGYDRGTALDDNRLNILSCEIKRINLPDSQPLYYIEMPEKPFSVLRNDFNSAVHFRVLSDIADKFDETKKTRIMFIVENQQTGLLACSYLSSLLDNEKYGNCKVEYGEQEVNLNRKVPIINALDIRSNDKRDSFANLSFFDGGLNMQTIGSTGNNIPWFEKYACRCPLIVMLKDTSFIASDLPSRLNDLGQNFDDIFIICVQESKNNDNQEPLYIGAVCSSKISEIANDISFESNYDTYRIEEPDITSEYFRKVLVDAAAEEGYGICESVDINEVLSNLKKCRSHSWHSNLTILQFLKKAISFKTEGKILKQKDFDFLKSNLFLAIKQFDKPAATEQHAVEKMNKEIYGLDDVKRTILEMVSVLKMRSEREKAGLKPPRINNTFVFLGPPGAGKTQMAEHLTNILFENNLLPGKQFLSINAAQLKAEYVGQTAPKVTAIFENYDAIFLDEAYSLTAHSGKGSMDTYSQEALAQLCVELEKHAKDKLVIFAGYGGNVESENNKMKEFLNANPGIASRITFTVEFPSYSPDIEMPEIFNRLVLNAEYDLEDGWRDIAIEFFKERANSESFGNGREARKLFQNAMVVQAARLYGKKFDVASLRLITCDDLKTAAARLLNGEKLILGKQRYRIGFGF